MLKEFANDLNEIINLYDESDINNKSEEKLLAQIEDLED